MMEELLFDDILYGERARKNTAASAARCRCTASRRSTAQDLLEDILAQPAGRRLGARRDAAAGKHRIARTPARGPAGGARGGAGRGTPLAAGAARTQGVTDLFANPPPPELVLPARSADSRGKRRVFGRWPAGRASARRGCRGRSSGSIRRSRRHPSGWRRTTPSSNGPMSPAPATPASKGATSSWSPRTSWPSACRSEPIVTVSKTSPTRCVARTTAARSSSWSSCRAGRAYMHLDTLFTPVDRGLALIYPPVVLPTGRGARGRRSRSICAPTR
jgi:hypothetical protein